MRERHEPGEKRKERTIPNFQKATAKLEAQLHAYGFSVESITTKASEELVKRGIYQLEDIKYLPPETPWALERWFMDLDQIGEVRARALVDTFCDFAEEHWGAVTVPLQQHDDGSSRAFKEPARGVWELALQSHIYVSKRVDPNEAREVRGKVAEFRSLMLEEADRRKETPHDGVFWRFIRRNPDRLPSEVSSLNRAIDVVVNDLPDAARLWHRSVEVETRLEPEEMVELLGLSSTDELEMILQSGRDFKGHPICDWAFYDGSGSVEFFEVPLTAFLPAPESDS